jgi:choline-sulfatase
MPWNGYPRPIAPNLTAFEKTAVSYTRAYAVSSYTAMSLGGLLSGRLPSELDRTGSFFARYQDSVLFFPELLQKAGVRTLSAQAHFYFEKEKAAFHQGFDVWEILPGLKKSNTTDENVTSPKHLEVALRHLGDKANDGKQIFAWYHFLDPHDQYMQHEGFGPFGKKERDRYDAEVAFTDHHVGKLIEFIDKQPWGRDTTIVITADHGEGFGEHKVFRHGFEVWEMLVHVPLMIRTPKGKPRRIDVPRSAIDLAPTILQLMGVEKDPAMWGTSLVSELEGGEAPARDVVIDLPRTSDNDRKRALVSGNLKLVAYGDDEAFELYDVVSDPGEKKNLRKSDPTSFEAMKAKYKALGARIQDKCPKTFGKLKGKKASRPC